MVRFPLNDLAAFTVVARERSFTRAAATLGISPSALSHAMRALENRLGVLLLARTTRAVSPTEAGQRLLSRLIVAMAKIDLGLAGLADRASTPTGRIRLTTFRYFADTILRKRLPAFLRDHPAVQVEVNVDDRLTDVVTAEFDGGIRFGNHVAKGAAAVRIGPDVPMVVVATPDYLARSGNPSSPYELSDHPCLNYRITSTGAVFAWTFTRAGKTLKVNVTGPLLANYGPLLLDAVRASVGLGFMLEEDVGAEIADGRLVRVLPEWSSIYPGPHLYHLDRARVSPAMAALIHYLQERRHVPDKEPHSRRLAAFPQGWAREKTLP